MGHTEVTHSWFCHFYHAEPVKCCSSDPCTPLHSNPSQLLREPGAPRLLQINPLWPPAHEAWAFSAGMGVGLVQETQWGCTSLWKSLTSSFIIDRNSTASYGSAQLMNERLSFPIHFVLGFSPDENTVLHIWGENLTKLNSWTQLRLCWTYSTGSSFSWECVREKLQALSRVLNCSVLLDIWGAWTVMQHYVFGEKKLSCTCQPLWGPAPPGQLNKYPDKLIWHHSEHIMNGWMCLFQQEVVNWNWPNPPSQRTSLQNRQLGTSLNGKQTFGSLTTVKTAQQLYTTAHNMWGCRRKLLLF